MDLVSIIIPAYNVAPYIDRCVASACGQTYSNIEVILVDDGSTDGVTPGKCDAWAAKDERVKVIHKPNGGLSDARNAGLDAASGEYIYFLDGDDYVSPELVETVLQNFDKEIDIVCFSFLPIDENGKVAYVPQPETGLFDFSSDMKRMGFILGKLLVHAVGWEAWNKMFRHSLIQRFHLRFADNNRIFAEDQYFSVCCCLHASAVKSIPNRLYYYMQRSDSIMGKCGLKNNIDRISLLSQAVFEHVADSEDCTCALAHFPLLHYMIIRNELGIMEYSRGMNRREIRDVLVNTLKNADFFWEHMKALQKYRKELYALLGSVNAERELGTVQYYLDGDYFMSRVRNRLITWMTPIIMKKDPKEARLAEEYNEFYHSGDKRIYLIGTEEFGNLGDNQIAESIHEFLSVHLSDYVVKEVTIREYPRQKQLLKKTIRPCDVILLTGGGNFGDTYPIPETTRRDIITTWPVNRKVVFPQTIYYSDTAEGRAMLADDKKVYTAENNLTIFARDHRSYEFAKENFSCTVYECPDIVLFSDKSNGSTRKKQITLCLRRDIEKLFVPSEQERLIDFLGTSGYTLKYADTQLDYHVKKRDRAKELRKIFGVWKESQLVITDRLHGMVFAAITGTPCIAFDNYNGKVGGTYAWIKYLPYIKYTDTAERAAELIPELLDCEQRAVYSRKPLMPYYDMLEASIRGVSAGG